MTWARRWGRGIKQWKSVQDSSGSSGEPQFLLLNSEGSEVEQLCSQTVQRCSQTQHPDPWSRGKLGTKAAQLLDPLGIGYSVSFQLVRLCTSLYLILCTVGHHTRGMAAQPSPNLLAQPLAGKVISWTSCLDTNISNLLFISVLP